MPMHYFLEQDLLALEESIKDAERRVKESIKEIGESCREGAETFHDNFGYEEGTRNANMWSARLRELHDIMAGAVLFTPEKSGDTVAIGRIVTITDADSGETMTLQIGSYMTIAPRKKDVESISYTSPMAIVLLGAKVNDIKTGGVGGKKRRFKIIEIK